MHDIDRLYTLDLHVNTKLSYVVAWINEAYRFDAYR